MRLHVISRRVTIADSDATGNIYFTVPFAWAEATLTDWLASAGHPISVLMNDNWAMPLLSCSAAYEAPLGVDDVVEITLFGGHVGRTSFALNFEVAHSGVIAVRVSCNYVWARMGTDANQKRLTSTPLPNWLRSSLEPGV